MGEDSWWDEEVYALLPEQLDRDPARVPQWMRRLWLAALKDMALVKARPDNVPPADIEADTAWRSGANFGSLTFREVCWLLRLPHTMFHD